MQNLSTALALEAGILFHSVIIGLVLGTLSTTSWALVAAIAFHQAFEAIGLSARLDSYAFPENKKRVSHTLKVVYGFSTPVGIAVGIAVQRSYAADGFVSLEVTGILDSVSEGIVMYTALGLLAREFVFNERLGRVGLGVFLKKIGCVLLGAVAMAVLAEWA